MFSFFSVCFLYDRLLYNGPVHKKQDGFHLPSIQMVGLSGIQMLFDYRTIWHPTSFRPFEYQTILVFRSPMYLHTRFTDLMFKVSAEVFFLQLLFACLFF